MSGGYDTKSSLSQVVSTKDGGNFETLPDLPGRLRHPCLVVVDKDTLFLAGGLGKNGAESGTYLFKG
jgi:hypothetical protein